MISIHDILAFIEYEKYFQSVEQARAIEANAAAPRPGDGPRIIRAGQQPLRDNEAPAGAERVRRMQSRWAA